MKIGGMAVVGGVCLVVAVGAGVLLKKDNRPSVEVVNPKLKAVTESIAVTGELRGLTETNVGGQISGRVTSLLVKEGDRVKKGQPLALLDDAVLQTGIAQAEETALIARGQVEQARDALRTAEAQRKLESRPALASDIARSKADTAQNVAVARAKLAAARQRLAELQRGDTEEQREQLSAQVAQAQVNFDLASKDYKRQRDLYQQGVIAQAALDTVEATRESARQTLANLKARQRQQQVGTRPETLDQAKADIEAAEATVTGAQATGEAQLRTLLAQPRPEDLLVADARVREARRALDVALLKVRQARTGVELARRQQRDAVVPAPFDGTVTKILTEVGGVVSSSQALLRLVRTGRPEIRADIDEKYLGKVKVGQEAIVTADGYPGEKVEARIRELGAQVDNSRGTIELRLDLRQSAAWLRPNQTLSVNIIVNRDSPRYLLPLSSVISAGGTSWAYIIKKEPSRNENRTTENKTNENKTNENKTNENKTNENQNGIITKQILDADSISVDGVPVRSGLSETDLVVANPEKVQPGQQVRAVVAKSAQEGSR